MIAPDRRSSGNVKVDVLAAITELFEVQPDQPETHDLANPLVDTIAQEDAAAAMGAMVGILDTFVTALAHELGTTRAVLWSEFATRTVAQLEATSAETAREEGP